jgi:hypothetical protein
MGKPLNIHPDVPFDAGHHLARVVSLLLCSALSLFFTLCASTIKKLVTTLRPCFARASPTDSFKAHCRTLMPSGPG